MKCPECGADQTAVTRTDLHSGAVVIRRRRKCLCCGCRFGTVEIVVTERKKRAGS